MNADSRLKFPLIELSEWIFEKEKVFFEILESEIGEIHHVKESQIEKHFEREIVDGNGFLVTVSNPKIVERKKSFLSSIFEPRSKVTFEFKNSGKKIDLETLKKRILSKSNQIFHITHNKIMSESDFRKEVEQSENYEKLISVATFLKYL
ncbi:hypothetical protein [Winogradskyella algicola]|uniref:hypothetical protein n=1 Tax=Winogradskyella algicola TaxID=2575815 RepID=UPI001109A76E|nr:hypothetical protein [Winogradskyella algicola]